MNKEVQFLVGETFLDGSTSWLLQIPDRSVLPLLDQKEFTLAGKKWKIRYNCDYTDEIRTESATIVFGSGKSLGCFSTSLDRQVLNDLLKHVKFLIDIRLEEKLETEEKSKQAQEILALMDQHNVRYQDLETWIKAQSTETPQ